MEQILEVGLTFSALSAIVYGITSAVYRTLPMDKLGEYTKGVKLLGAILVGLGIAFGFKLDLSSAVVYSEPISPAIGYVFTAVLSAIGSSGVFTATKNLK